MKPNLDFAEQCQIVSGFLPADMNSGAGAGDWVSLKNYEKMSIIFFKGAGTATQDPTVQLIQGKTNSGGTPLALDVIDKVYVKQATNLLSTGTFSVVTQAVGNTYTEGTSGEKALIWAIDFYADDLDIANGYTCFRATIADVGTITGPVPYGAVLYLLWPPRYGEQTLLSAIVD